MWLKQVRRFREGSCSASVISSPHVGGAGSFWYFLGKMKTFFVMNSVCRMKDENNKSATQIQDMPRHDNLIWCLSLLLHRGSRFLRKVFSLLPLGLETELPYLSMKYNQGSSKKKKKKEPHRAGWRRRWWSRAGVREIREVSSEHKMMSQKRDGGNQVRTDRAFKHSLNHFNFTNPLQEGKNADSA